MSEEHEYLERLSEQITTKAQQQWEDIVSLNLFIHKEATKIAPYKFTVPKITAMTHQKIEEWLQNER